MARRAQQDRHAVTHIEHGDAQSAVLERSGRNEEKRQEAGPAQPASRRAAGCQQQNHCACRQHDGPRRRRVLCPDRRGHSPQPRQREHAAGRNRVRKLQNEVERHDGADERGRHHDEADDRDRERVGQRRNERDLLEQGKQKRNECSGHSDLRPDKGGKPVTPPDPPGCHIHDHRDRTE